MFPQSKHAHLKHALAVDRVLSNIDDCRNALALYHRFDARGSPSAVVDCCRIELMVVGVLNVGSSIAGRFLRWPAYTW